MRGLILFAFVGTLVGCQPAEEPAARPVEKPTPATDSFNAVDVDPDTHKVQLENEYVRVIRYRAPAGYRGASANNCWWPGRNPRLW